MVREIKSREREREKTFLKKKKVRKERGFPETSEKEREGFRKHPKKREGSGRVRKERFSERKKARKRENLSEASEREGELF